MSNVRAVHGDLRQYGHAMDPTGVRISVDIKTQRQLNNAMPMLPFGELDRMILRAARREKNIVRGTAENVAGRTKDSARYVFEMGNKAFSFAQLYRLSYIHTHLKMPIHPSQYIQTIHNITIHRSSQ